MLYMKLIRLTFQKKFQVKFNFKNIILKDILKLILRLDVLTHSVRRGLNGINLNVYLV